MNVVPRLRHQQIVFFGIIVIIIFFFWNVSLFSDRLCQNELEKAIEEKSSILAVLKNQIQSLEDEKAKGFEDQNNLLNKLKNQLQSLKDTPPSGQSNPRIGIILFTYNRPDYLKRTLTTLMKYLPSEVPLVISQDSDNQEVSSLIKEYERALHIKHHPRESIHKKSGGEPDSYYYISSHYKFGLQHVFDRLLFDAVIIIEDDMEISPDFFDYFISLYSVLKYDDTLFCVSAWNDNGQSPFVKNADVIYRSDFFPGLGWMLTRDFWDEIKNKWPGAYWDDWLREPDQRKDRDCIRPEISRTYTFGKEGSSMGQFYDKYLANIKLNKEKVNWGSKDLSFLNKDTYDKEFDKEIDSCTEISEIQDIDSYQNKKLLLYYADQNSFTHMADRLEIMSDHKAGVPRTGYSTRRHKDCVTFWKNSNQIFMCQR